MNHVYRLRWCRAIPKKKYFVKNFLSWDCEPEFGGSKAGFKIIKGKNITEQNGKLIRDFFLKDFGQSK